MIAARLAVALGAAALSAPLTAGQPGPWTEAVVSVTDIAAATRLFRVAGGWRTTHRGAVSREELRYWVLPDTVSARFERLCAPGADTGCLRFVCFRGATQRPVRRALRAWDSGGIYSIMVRSDNVEALFDTALSLGWWAESAPVRFSFGTSDLRNVVLTGPHGINLAVYERVSPPFTAFRVGRISQAFNSMRMVRDKARARAFYETTLGFSVLFDSNAEPAEPAPSNFGIPLDHTPRIRRSAAALQPAPGETGRVEVMQIEGFGGQDASAHASPPNLGILSVRYPVADIDSYREAVKERGGETAYEAMAVPIGGIGIVNIFSVRDPDGNITEFYDLAKGRR